MCYNIFINIKFKQGGRVMLNTIFSSNTAIKYIETLNVDSSAKSVI